jgi:hypothetical protein
MVRNVVLSLVPKPVITGIIATAIPAAITPYSIAVAALSSFRNRLHRATSDAGSLELLLTGEVSANLRPLPTRALFGRFTSAPVEASRSLVGFLIAPARSPIRLARILATLAARPFGRDRSHVSSQIGASQIFELFQRPASYRGSAPAGKISVPRSSGTARKIRAANYWRPPPEFRKNTSDRSRQCRL